LTPFAANEAFNHPVILSKRIKFHLHEVPCIPTPLYITSIISADTGAQARAHKQGAGGALRQEGRAVRHDMHGGKPNVSPPVLPHLDRVDNYGDEKSGIWDDRLVYL